MNYDVTVNSIVDKIKKMIKPCFHCGESLNVVVCSEKNNDVIGWSLTIGCPNCCMMDKHFVKTIGAVEVELLRLLRMCE